MILYRDTEGDLWAVTSGGRLFLAVAPTFVWEGPANRSFDEVQATYGPLVELTAEESARHHAGLRWTSSLLDLLARLRGED